jgi:hypothetical protein
MADRDISLVQSLHQLDYLHAASIAALEPIQSLNHWEEGFSFPVVNWTGCII